MESVLRKGMLRPKLHEKSEAIWKSSEEDCHVLLPEQITWSGRTSRSVSTMGGKPVQGCSFCEHAILSPSALCVYCIRGEGEQVGLPQSQQWHWPWNNSHHCINIVATDLRLSFSAPSIQLFHQLQKTFLFQQVFDIFDPSKSSSVHNFIHGIEKHVLLLNKKWFYFFCRFSTICLIS